MQWATVETSCLPTTATINQEINATDPWNLMLSNEYCNSQSGNRCKWSVKSHAFQRLLQQSTRKSVQLIREKSCFPTTTATVNQEINATDPWKIMLSNDYSMQLIREKSWFRMTTATINEEINATDPWNAMLSNDYSVHLIRGKSCFRTAAATINQEITISQSNSLLKHDSSEDCKNQLK